MKRYLPILAVLALTACANTSPKNDVAAMAAALSTADTAALAYVNLPLCASPGATAVCSDKDVIAKIGPAAQAAYIAVKNAEAAVNNPALGQSAVNDAMIAASQALQTLQQLVALLPKGN